MGDLWGYVIVAVVVLALIARWYVGYSAHRANRAMIEMNERQKRG